MRLRLAAILPLLLALCIPAHARERVWGYCSQGGVSIIFGGGGVGSPKAQGSYPGCTTTVYLTGTLTPAQIYSDNLGSVKSNPFVADTTTGFWFFYADDGRYDVRLSGGGIPTPFTLADIKLVDQTISGTGIFSLNGLGAFEQLFTVGSSGTDVNIQSDVDTHTYNFPDASATARGVVTTGAQVFGGNKTFFGDTLMDGSLYVTGLFSTDHPIEITGEACGTSEANVGLFGFDPTTGLPCFSYDGSAPASMGGVASVTGTSPIVSSGGVTPAISCPTCEISSNKNAISGYAGLTAAARLNAAQGQEVWASSDLTDFANKSGTGTTILGVTLAGIALKDTLRWNGSNWVNNPQPRLDEINNLADDTGAAFSTVVTVDPVSEFTALSVAANRTATTNGVFTINGIEGVARSRGADEAGTFRGGLFRTYIDPTFTATARTSVGLEASARAGTGTVAEAGTAFVGARIWMAPDFTGGSLGNINNFHGLWVYNEHATNAVTNAIFVSDAGGGYTNGLNFNGATLTNEFQFSNAMTLKKSGANAWDGLTLTKATTTGPTVGNEGVGLFIENNRTAAIDDQATVTGIEAVTRSRSSGVNLTIRGGHFRTYVDDTLGGTAITSVGLDGSARASGSVVAAPGTAFVGIRSYMAPGFTGGSLPNVTNFHAFWGYNESATQAVTNGLYLSDAGGGYTYGIDLSAATIGTAAIKTGAQLVDFGGKTQAPRFHSSGTALVSGDFVATGWGAGAALSAIRGADQAFSVTVTAGTAPALNPTLDLTFTDGTWTTVPVFVCKQSAGSDAISDITQSESATVLTLTWLGTPVDTKTYTFSCVGMGI